MRLFVSFDDEPRIDPTRESPGPDWILAGDVDEGEQNEFRAVKRRLLTGRGSKPRATLELHALFEPDSEALERIREQGASFWIAVQDRAGINPPALVSTARAVVPSTTRLRAPEVSPAALVYTERVSLRIVAPMGELPFERHDVPQ